MKFYGGVLGSTLKNWLNFGGDLGILRWENEQKNTTIEVAYPDHGAGNDPKLYFYFYLFLFLYFYLFLGGSLSPPKLNTFSLGNMGVMICLGQGGLRSLSASSLFVCLFVCGQHYSKSYERIGMKCYGRALSSTRIKFWWWSGYCMMSKRAKNTVIVVAYPDRRAGNDPEPFFFFFFFF